MRIILSVLLLFLTSCAIATPQPAASQVNLQDLGPAPELTNDTWLNSAQPLRLADLHGKVVLLEMWTFGCINCRHTIPQLNTWYKTYASQGLIIIGNHYPKFSYEADLANLEQAVHDLKIEYPVAQDNQGATWKAYNNNYWPAIYLIDKSGHSRYVHIGEGAYDITEAAIQDLLAEAY
ncbi:MAG: redoxin domain-containing protein [Chloroflexota bacterium]